MDVIRALLFSSFVVVLVLIGVRFPYLVIFVSNWKLADKIAFGSLVVLAVTGFIVWKYTKEAQTSNEIQERPILNLYIRNWKFKVRNVGLGPAYNIEFYPLESKDWRYTPRFDEPNQILEGERNKGDERDVSFEIKSRDGQTYRFDSKDQASFDSLCKDLFPYRQSDLAIAGTILITYTGLNGRQYHSVFRFYPKVLLKPEMKLLIEFVHYGEGECDLTKARLLCSRKLINKR